MHTFICISRTPIRKSSHCQFLNLKENNSPAPIVAPQNLPSPFHFSSDHWLEIHLYSFIPYSYASFNHINTYEHPHRCSMGLSLTIKTLMEDSYIGHLQVKHCDPVRGLD